MTHTMTSAPRSANFIRIAILTTSLLMAAGATATAESDDPFDKPRTNLGFGMLVGSASVGYISGPGVGMHAEIGRQFGKFGVYGEYNLLSVGESSYDVEDPIRGFMHRVAGNVRYTFAKVGSPRVPVQGAFWLEAGMGRQVVQWHKGGKLTRNDFGFGFGAQTNFRIGRRSAKPNVIGFHYAFKAFLTPSPDADAMLPATCAGPCDEPTPPSPHDLGLFFNMGLMWGK